MLPGYGDRGELFRGGVHGLVLSIYIMCNMHIYVRMALYPLPTYLIPRPIFPYTQTTKSGAIASRYNPAAGPPPVKEGMMEKKTGRETVGGGWESRYFEIKYPVSLFPFFFCVYECTHKRIDTHMSFPRLPPALTVTTPLPPNQPNTHRVPWSTTRRRTRPAPSSAPLTWRA